MGAQSEQAPTATPFVPSDADLEKLRAAAASCRGCHLYENATQTVFGEGDEHARLLLVGEQPGDIEDRRGRPFVGPAGILLNRALDDAGIERADAYVTNAVKHFKFTQSAPGKRRIHSKPDLTEVNACRPWLEAEIALLHPEVVVLLGATAAQALLGPKFRVTRSRGELMAWPPPDLQIEVPAVAPAEQAEAEQLAFGDEPVDSPPAGPGAQAAYCMATIHPSAVLRADDRDSAYEGLVSDLRVAASVLR